MGRQLTAPQMLYRTRYDLGTPHDGICYLCGGALYDPVPLSVAIKKTFTDIANTHNNGTGVCRACGWFLENRQADLAEWVGKSAPVSPRSYSYIHKNHKWLCYSKAHKAEIVECLTNGYMPEVCIIAVGGQKHLFYKARVNPSNQLVGWVTYEEETLFLDQNEFISLFEHVSAMYLPKDGYNKQQILTGRYIFGKFNNVELYRQHESHIAPYRGSTLLNMAVYLITKSDEKEEENESPETTE